VLNKLRKVGQIVEILLYLPSVLQTINAVHKPAAFEENQRRSAGNLVLGRNKTVHRRIHSGKLDPSAILSGQFFQNRCQSLAVRSGRGEELHQNRTGEVENLGPEVPVVDDTGMARK
jgi:hypothetical protein